MNLRQKTKIVIELNNDYPLFQDFDKNRTKKQDHNNGENILKLSLFEGELPEQLREKRRKDKRGE